MRRCLRALPLEKATHQQVKSRLTPVQPVNGARQVFGATNDSFALQRALGNQGMQSLLESGRLQAKLRVSQPGDADERDADRAAEHVVSAQAAPRLQRKCACGSCAQCQQGEETVLHRGARTAPMLQSFPFSIQRQAATATTAERSYRASTADADTRRNQSKHPGEHPRTLIVEDDAPSLGPGQMRKREFVSLLQSTTCATADAVLESVGHSTKGCPYIKKWLEHYKGQDAQHLTRAMHKYAPETGRARSAHEAIALVNQRVERAARTWAKTGKVTDLPDGIQEETAGGGGFLGAVIGFAHSGFGSALLGFIGGGGKKGEQESGARASGVQRKSQGGASAGEPDAAAVQAQLGAGQALDGRVQGQISSAFGYDFSGVRVHTDATAGELSGQLNARAFTIGRDVAFAAGEYQPGTLIGDALIAHELAHVVQQGGGNPTGGPQTKDAALSDDSSLEHEADRSAVGAVVSSLTGAKKGLAEVGVNALPRLKSGLKLQKCNKKPPVKAPTPPPAAAPIRSVEPEQSFFFEDPAIQVVDEGGQEIDFSKSGEGSGQLATMAERRHQVVVDKPKDFSVVGTPRTDPVVVVIRFAYPASEFSEGKESGKLKSAKGAVIGAVAQLFGDLGTFRFANPAEERRILQERARLTEALKGFTRDNPLNIYLAEETEEETRSGAFFPTTARVFVNLNDVGDTNKLKTAIRIPLHSILGGPNPAKGAGEDPAASRAEMEKTVLHESIHALLIGRSADSDAEWKRVQGKLAIKGPDKVQQPAQDLVHAYLLAQEELFAYSAVELLFPKKPGEMEEGKPGYEIFVNTANLFFKKHGVTLKDEKIKLSVSDKVKSKVVPWEIVYSYPTDMSLVDKDFEVLQVVLKSWPLQLLTRRR